MEKKEYILPRVTAVSIKPVTLLDGSNTKVETNVNLQDGGGGNGTGSSEPHGIDADFEL